MGLFWLIFLFDEFCHGLLILFFKILGDLFNHKWQRIVFKIETILLLLFTFLISGFWRIHGLNKLQHRICRQLFPINPWSLDNIEQKILQQLFIILNIVIFEQLRIIELTETSQIHRDLVIQSHKLWGFIKVLQVFLMVEYFQHSVD